VPAQAQVSFAFASSGAICQVKIARQTGMSWDARVHYTGCHVLARWVRNK
jgi:hypothetical protein